MSTTRKKTNFLAVILILIGSIGVSAGCAGRAKSSPRDGGEAKGIAGYENEVLRNLKSVSVEGPVLLELKAEMNRNEKMRYGHKSVSAGFEDGQIRNQREEGVEFTALAETKSVDSTLGVFTQKVTTSEKIGTMDLNQFAMPEIDEQLEYKMSKFGQILRAGSYPAQSLFYVSPVSLSGKPVAVGETWTMKSKWVSLDEGVPFRMDMVSILKRWVECGADQCAEIEVSGAVFLDGPLAQQMGFRSEFRGSLLFARNAGLIVYSRMDSEDLFGAETVERKIRSCIEAVLVEPAPLMLPGFAVPGVPAGAKNSILLQCPNDKLLVEGIPKTEK